MGQRPHQKRRGLRREDRVGIEGDDVANVPERRRIAHDCGEGLKGAAPQEPVELGELPPLPLPPHPHTLPRVPAPRAMEEIERVVGAVGVPAVQLANAGRRGLEDRRVARPRLRRSVGEVAQDREMEVRLAVGEILDLEVLEGLAYRLDAVEERRDDHRRPELRRHAAGWAQIQLGEDPRRQERRDELVHHVHRDVVRREQGEQQHGGPRRARLRAGQPEHGRERRHSAGEHAADEHHVRVTAHPAVQPFAGGGLIPGRALERGAALVHEVVAHVRAARVGRVVGGGGAREVVREAGHGRFVPPGPPGNALHDVAILVARRERHALVGACGIFAQHRLHDALPLDERLPVHAGDGAQAGDAVRHHDLRQRGALGRSNSGILAAQSLVGDPLLEPDQRWDRDPTGAELVQEAGNERRGERRGLGDELVERCG